MGYAVMIPRIVGLALASCLLGCNRMVLVLPLRSYDSRVGLTGLRFVVLLVVQRYALGGFG